MTGSETLAAAVVVVLLILVTFEFGMRGASKNAFANWGPGDRGTSVSDLAVGYPYNYSLATSNPAEVAENRMYSSAEVDPIVTGQLYSASRAAGPGRRWIYGGRTSHGGDWGMNEFSTGVPGQAGVDVGLLGMRDYSLDGRPDVYDDGIPENWRFPSTPMNWYVPQNEDYYDVEAQGPGVYKKDLVSLREPDHEPYVN